jgi:hypothetical protein
MKDHLTTLREVRDALAMLSGDDWNNQFWARGLAKDSCTNLNRLIAEVEAAQPVAWHVCSYNKDGTLSLEHAAARQEAAHEHINDAITEDGIEEAASWVVRPVYTHPAPTGFTAHDMATAAADGFRDGVASVGKPTSEAGLPPLPASGSYRDATGQLHPCSYNHQDMQSYAREAVAQAVEAYRADAERYRWLCSYAIVPTPSLWDCGVGFVTPALPRKSGAMTKPELDAEIDAAIRARGQGGAA